MSLRSSPALTGLSSGLLSSSIATASQHAVVSIHHVSEERPASQGVTPSSSASWSLNWRPPPLTIPDTPHHSRKSSSSEHITLLLQPSSLPPSLRLLLASLSLLTAILTLGFAAYGIVTFLNLPASSTTLSLSPLRTPTALTFLNYTVAPHLHSRWPVPYPGNTHRTRSDAETHGASDAFARHSPGRFSSTRGAVISLYTSSQREWLSRNFHANAATFFEPMSEHADWLLFYPLYPTDVSRELHDLLTSLNASLITDPSTTASTHPSSDLYGRLRELQYPHDLAAVREYLTAGGVHVITVAVVINLPQYLAEDAGLLLRADWMTCWGIRWDMDYALYSGAVFPTQLMVHDVLVGYDLFLKLDLDVRITQRMALSPFHRMAAQQCVYLHAEYRDRVEDCGLDAPDAVAAWAAAHGAVPAANATRWFWSTDYYWGNFMGGWLGWMRSPQNVDLSRHLYEDRERSGYFRRRWGDQPSVVKMLGMWYRLGEDEVRGVSEGVGPVCDLTKERKDGVIVHKWTRENPFSDF